MPMFTNLMMQTPKQNQMTPEMSALSRLNKAEPMPEEEQKPLYQTPKKPSAEQAKETVTEQPAAPKSRKIFGKKSSDMRRAVVLKELLDKPLALRKR